MHGGQCFNEVHEEPPLGFLHALVVRNLNQTFSRALYMFLSGVVVFYSAARKIFVLVLFIDHKENHHPRCYQQ